MDDIYKNIEKYNPNQKHKILFVFNYIIADMLRKNNLNPIVTELLTRSRELYFLLILLHNLMLLCQRILD